MRPWPIALSLLIAAAALAAEPATRPSKLAPYADLEALAAKYDQILAGEHWKPVFSDDFHASATRHWMQLDRNSGGPIPASVSYAIVDGHESLVFDARPTQVGLLAIGPKVQGSFAVEFEGRTMGDRACDLSIVCDRIGKGPAFQFGGYNNTRNTLWAPSTTDRTGPFTENEIDDATLIQLGKWTRVRMEVRANTVTGIVDDKIIGTASFNLGSLDPNQQFQPAIYAFDNWIALRMARVEVWDPEVKGAAADDAWKKVFADTTHEHVKARIDAITELLGDDDERVRDSASDLLARLGSLAIPSLQAVCHSGFPEQERRAILILSAEGAALGK